MGWGVVDGDIVGLGVRVGVTDGEGLGVGESVGVGVAEGVIVGVGDTITDDEVAAESEFRAFILPYIQYEPVPDILSA